jgi:Tat protein secretion system quality control protein TatD with DNase activity
MIDTHLHLSHSRFGHDRAAALGFHLGVGGTLTYGDPELAAVVSAAPPHLLLLETDAPYLTPEPGRRERNEPARLFRLPVAAPALDRS